MPSHLVVAQRARAKLATGGLLGVLCLVMAPLCWAGSAEVRYSEPERFSDAGRGVDGDRVRAELTRVIQSLAASMLPADQRLQVEVIDIDLAGELRPSGRQLQDLRVLRGRADWPRLHLRYTLSRGEQVIDKGEARLADMAYLEHADHPPRGPLPYESRMLADWFRERLAAQAGTAQR